MLSDLAALVPPLLVCAAFVFAVAAFLRRELRNADGQPQGEAEAVSTAAEESEAGRSNPGALNETRLGHDAARADRMDGTGRASDD